MSRTHPFLWTQTSSNQDKMRRGLSCLYTANARNLPTLDIPEALSLRQTLFPVLTCFYPLSCKTIYSSEHKLSSISKKRRLHISRDSSMIFSASFHTSVYFQLLQSFPLQIWPASSPVCCCRCSCEPLSLNLHKRTSGGKEIYHLEDCVHGMWSLRLALPEGMAVLHLDPFLSKSSCNSVLPLTFWLRSTKFIPYWLLRNQLIKVE